MKRILFVSFLLLGWGGKNAFVSLHAQDCGFTIQSDANCQLSPIRFVPNEQQGFAYAWDFGDGDSSTLKSPVHVYEAGGATSVQVRLTVTDTLKQVSTCTQTITLLPATGSIQATGDDFNCDKLPQPDSVFTTTFTIQSGGGGDMIWDWGDGSPPLTTNALSQSHTYNRYGKFYLTITPVGQSCPEFTRRIRFYGQPSSVVGDPIGGSDNILCEGEEICIWNESNLANGPIDYFIWEWAIEELATDTTYFRDTAYDGNPRCYTYNFPSNQVPPFRQGVVRLTAFNECFDSLGINDGGALYTHFQTSQINIFAKPRARFTPPETVCESDPTVNFSNQSAPSSSDYEWNFGDPQSPTNTSTEANPSHTFSGPGRYIVTLTARNGCGEDQQTQVVDVLEDPTALAVASDTEGCFPFRVTFTNQSTPLGTNQYPVQYTWEVNSLEGNGRWIVDSTTLPLNPEFTFLDTGRYEVILTFETDCDTKEWKDTILVGGAPRVSLAEIADTCNQVCILPEATFNDYGLPITSYLWEFEDGAPSSSTDSIPPAPICFGPGTHTVTLRATNECGEGNARQMFSVADLSSINAGSDVTICLNQPLPLRGDPPGGWWEGEGVVDSLFIPPDTGRFELVYHFGNGECAVSDTMIVTVIGIPSADILVPDTSVCQGSPSIPITVNQPGGSWGCSFGEHGIFSTDSVGMFSCSYTLIDTLTGCSASDTLSIEVRPKPESCVRDTSFCLVDEVVTLTACPEQGGSYEWQGPGIVNATQGGFNPMMAGNGQHLVEFEFTNDEGCSVLDTIRVSVVNADSISAGMDQSLCLSEEGLLVDDFGPSGGSWSIEGEFLSPDSFYVEIETLVAHASGAPSGSIRYQLGSGSCAVSDELMFTLLDTLEVEAGMDTIVCEGSSPVSLGNRATPLDGRWAGTGIMDAVQGLFDPSELVPGQTSSITYTLTHPNGCTSNDYVAVLVDALPSIDFLLPTDSCVNQLLVIENQSTHVVECNWDFGNNETSDLCTPRYAYPDTGTYEVTLTGTSVNQCQASLSKPITIFTTPTPQFVMDAPSGCANADGTRVVSFTDQSDPAGGSYAWQFGNGDSSLLPNPPPIEFSQGPSTVVYPVSLTITNQCAAISVVDSVSVRPRPQVNWSPQLSEGCSPLLIEFGNTTLGDPAWFRWDLANGSTSEDSLPESVYYFAEPPDSTTYYPITLISGNACGEDTLTKTITVNPNTMNAFFHTDDPEGCIPHTVRLEDFSGAPNVSWRFYDPNGIQVGTSELRAPVITLDTPGTHLVEMYADNGCSYDTNQVAITVFPNRPARFVGPEEACVQDTVNFRPITLEGIAAFIWDFGDGDSARSLGGQHAYTSPGTYSVSLTTLSDSLGCPNTWDTLIRVRPLPVAQFTLSDTSGCVPLTIEANQSPAGMFSSWETGDGNTSQQPSIEHTYAEAGRYELRLQVADLFGCTSDTSAEIIVHELPIASFEAANDTLCAGTSLDLENTSQGAEGQTWAFGNGDSSTITSPTVPYEEAGAYSIVLTSINRFGCTDEAQTQVRVLPQAEAGFTVEPPQGCAPLTVTVSQESSQFSQAYWDFGDGRTLSTPQPGNHVYAQGDTTFSITLVVDTAGYCADTLTRFLRVGVGPTAGFEYTLSDSCQSGTLTLQNTSETGRLPLDVEWWLNDQLISSAPEPAPISLDVDQYELLQVVVNDLGCRDSFLRRFEVYPQPVANMDASDLQGCSPLEVQFANRSSDASHIQWIWGDGQPSLVNVQEPRHTFFLSDDSVQVHLIADTAGVCRDTATLTIVVASKPAASFAADVREGCGRQSVAFTNGSNTQWLPLTYAWDFDGGSPEFSSQVNPTALFTADQAPNTYRVQLLARNSFGCTDTAFTTITMYPQPLAMFTALAGERCTPQLVEFQNISENATHYYWDFGEPGAFSRVQSPSHVYELAGTYSVSLVVSYEEKCWDSLRLQDVVQVEQSPIADFSFTDSLSSFGNPNGTITFRNLTLFGERYEWDFGDGSALDTEVHPTHEYEVNSTYEVTLTAYNSNGCVHSVTKPVNPDDFGNLYIPNAMAPHAGPSTEKFTKFQPIGIGLDTFHIEVFNQLGNRVWTSDALDELGRPAESWNGVSPGATVVGRREVFVWKVMEATFVGGRSWGGPREGTLTIIR